MTDDKYLIGTPLADLREDVPSVCKWPHIIVIIGIIILCVAAITTFAGTQKTKDGHDAYWKNRIALAHDGAYIDDELVPQFLAAPESFQTDTATGELLTGAMRRSVAQNDNMGWLMKVVKQTEVKTEAGTTHRFYNIEMFLVFDLEKRK